MENQLSKQKWHYFNSEDPECEITHDCKIIHFTYCGRKVINLNRFTEFKDQVNCRKCLQKLIRYDKHLTKE